MSNQAKALSDALVIGAPLEPSETAGTAREIEVDGRVIAVSPQDPRTILELLLAAGITPPNSCRAGVCMACAAVVELGTVTQNEPGSLREADLKSGKMLACLAVPASKRVKIRFIG